MNAATAETLFSSDRQEWETPPEVFEPLDREFGFTLDVCATPGNAKCPSYFTSEDDGLAQEWSGVCSMNPPYGRDVGRWIAKAAESTCTVVCLVAARTDIRWWHEHVMAGAEVRLIRGRLRFVGADGPAPFPSAVVVCRERACVPCFRSWDERRSGQAQVFSAPRRGRNVFRAPAREEP